MKYVTIPLQQMFKLRGRLCRKTGHTGYMPIGEEYMGEIQFSKEDNDRIEYPIIPDASVPKPEAVAEKTPMPKKKSIRKSPEKPTTRNSTKKKGRP